MNEQILRIFLSSTSKDLDAYRAAARDVIDEQGWHADMMESFKAGPTPTIEACQERVRAADAVVVIIAFRRGWVPSPEEGGDGRRSIVAWELDAADRMGIPTLVFMANESWPGNLWEQDDNARAWLSDFRASFNRFASSFDYEPSLADPRASFPVFRSKIRDVLVANREKLLGKPPRRPSAQQSSSAIDSRSQTPSLLLRGPRLPQVLPNRPYPLLEAYDHPETFAGREDDVTELSRLLTLRQPLICIHAPSGAGKSSVLHAGLLPRLATERLPACLDLHVDEPGLGARLLSELADWPGSYDDSDWEGFAERVVKIHAAGGVAPVFILDQFERAFHFDQRQEALARIGPIIASTFRRFPGIDGAVCRWVLAYRQDFHGDIMSWLEDVLVTARMPGRRIGLPHDLRSADRCVTWALPVLGQAHPGGDVMEAAIKAFTAAMEKPLQIVDDNGRPRYPWQIEHDDAVRLARAFAEQRVEHPDRPLTPQFQVVLGQLLTEAGTEPDGRRVIRVPPDPTSLVRDALEAHLRRSLEEAFPATRSGRARAERTRALLALREMCESDGRRARDVPEATLSAALGENGAEMIDRLTASTVRLIVPQSHPDGSIWYCLPHDSLAAVVSKLFQNDGRLAEYSLDKNLVALWRLVAQRSEYFERTQDPAALDLSRSQLRAIAQSRDTLLWDSSRATWLEKASEARARRDRQRTVASVAAAVVVVALGTVGWVFFPRAIAESEQQIRERVRSADPAQALEALSDLATKYGYNASRTAEVLRGRTRRDALMMLVDGPRTLPLDRRLPVLIPVIRTLFDEYVTDRMAAGAMLAALDHYNGESVEEGRELRRRIVGQLRQSVSVPPLNEKDWVSVSTSNGRMVGVPLYKSPAGDDNNGYLRPIGDRDFRLLRREVTVREYLIFDPSYSVDAFRFALGAPRNYTLLSGRALAKVEGFPAVGVSWFEAYAYAVWLGGALPTSAQWQDTCAKAFPDAKSKPSDPDAGPPTISPEILKHLAWFSESGSEEQRGVHPVAQLRPDALGFYDLLGNASEWADEWLESRRDETRDGKPVTELLASQVGGDSQTEATYVHCSRMVYGSPTDGYSGFRVIIPSSVRP